MHTSHQNDVADPPTANPCVCVVEAIPVVVDNDTQAAIAEAVEVSRKRSNDLGVVLLDSNAFDFDFCKKMKCSPDALVQVNHVSFSCYFLKLSLNKMMRLC
jgi:hypothetical protein